MQGGETEALGELQALPAVAPAIVSVNAHAHMCGPYCSGTSGLQLSHLFSVPDPLPHPHPPGLSWVFHRCVSCQRTVGGWQVWALSVTPAGLF